jgi:hypothetical protein
MYTSRTIKKTMLDVSPLFLCGCFSATTVILTCDIKKKTTAPKKAFVRKHQLSYWPIGSSEDQKRSKDKDNNDDSNSS